MLQWISLGAWKLGKWHPHFLANVDCNPQDRNKENWMPFSGLLRMKGVSSLQRWSFPGQNGPPTSLHSHSEDTDVKAVPQKVSWQVHASLPFLPLSPSGRQTEITLIESKYMEQGIFPELLYLILINPRGLRIIPILLMRKLKLKMIMGCAASYTVGWCA